MACTLRVGVCGSNVSNRMVENKHSREKRSLHIFRSIEICRNSNRQTWTYKNDEVVYA